MRLAKTVSLLMIVAGSAQAQSWRVETSGTSAELRGLSVVNANVAWASGTNGTVLRTTDGEHWQAMQVPDAGALDFRDIHAIDARSAVVMSAGPGGASRLFRTTDGGAAWRQVMVNQYEKGFWDAIAFWDAKRGILFGDPVGDRFQVYTTADGGESWREVAATGLESLPNEGAFAASGTCLTVAGSSDAWIASGGAAVSRVFHSTDGGQSWKASATPIPAAAATRGVFSLAFLTPRLGMAVGGDYKQSPEQVVNGARSDDGGATWSAAPVAPAGYMSVVATVPGAANALVAGGLAGSGYSLDAGRTWRALDTTPLNAIAFASANRGWAVGPKGLLMRYQGPPLDAPR